MLRTSLLALPLLALAACESTRVHRPYALAETPAEEAVEGRSTWGAPLVVPGTSIRVVPFARETELHWFGDRDRFAESDYYAGARGSAPANTSQRRTESGELRWHNGVVVDLSEGSQFPLLEQRGVISRYWMRLDRGDDGAERGTALILSATVEDSNGDGKLDSLDASRALLPWTGDAEPRFASPAGTQLRDVLYDPSLEIAILMLATDLDGDGRFTDLEPPQPFVLDLEVDSQAPLRPLIDEQTAQRVEAALGARRR